MDALTGDGVRDPRTYGMTKHQEKARLRNFEESLEVKNTFGMEDLGVVGRAEEDSEE